MSIGHPASPKLIKGAFVELAEPFLGPVPNVIVFQYNPATVSRSLTPWAPPSAAGGTREGGEGSGTRADEPAQAAPYDPQETLSMTLELDATDALEFPAAHPIAVVSGVADRMAAIEELLYPVGDDLSVLGDFFGSLGGSVDAVPRLEVPVVLFVLGPGLVLPVRLTSYSVEMQAFNPLLYPIRAAVSVGLKVFTSAELTRFGASDSAAGKLAIGAYKFTRAQRETLARLNLANSVESILGMLPI